MVSLCVVISEFVVVLLTRSLEGRDEDNGCESNRKRFDKIELFVFLSDKGKTTCRFASVEAEVDNDVLFVN